jgi:hypothetical protein
MFEQLIVNEAKLPIDWQWCGDVIKVGFCWFHIESDFKFRWTIWVGNDRSRQNLDLRNKYFARFNGSDVRKNSN